MSRRLQREERTIAVMVRMYCRDHHSGGLPPQADDTAGGGAAPGRHLSDGLCPACAALLEYARQRLERCPFADQKPTCARCTVHCYRPDMRAQVRTVMRYAGPRMTLRHPYLALRHLLDRRGTPQEGDRGSPEAPRED